MASNKKSKKTITPEIVINTSTKILIEDDYESYSKQPQEKYGLWSEQQIHNIQGFKVVDSDSDSSKQGRYFISNKVYHDLTISYPLEENKEYYLLYVLWSWGDSFGSGSGRIEYIGLYQNFKDAEVNRKLINEHASVDEYKLTNAQRRNYDAYSIELISPSGNKFEMHVPWNGYFESLENVIIKPIMRIN